MWDVEHQMMSSKVSDGDACVRDAHFNAKGTRIALAIVGEEEGAPFASWEVWEVPTQQLVAKVRTNAKHGNDASCALSPDGRWLAGIGPRGDHEEGRTIFIWDVSHHDQEAATLVCDGPVDSFVFSDNNTLIVSTNKGHIELWRLDAVGAADVPTSAVHWLRPTSLGPKRPFSAVAINRAGTEGAVIHAAGYLARFHLADGLIETFQIDILEPCQGQRSVGYGKDDSLHVVNTNLGGVQLVHHKSGKTWHLDHPDEVTHICFTAKGDLVVSSSTEVRCWRG